MAIVDAAPTTGLLNTLRKQLLRFANVRRRRPRNTVVGAAAADYLGGLLVDESSSDEQAIARVARSKLNVAVNDFATGSTDARILTLGADDVFVFTSPMQQFTFLEQSGPLRVPGSSGGAPTSASGSRPSSAGSRGRIARTPSSLVDRRPSGRRSGGSTVRARPQEPSFLGLGQGGGTAERRGASSNPGEAFRGMGCRGGRARALYSFLAPGPSSTPPWF
jgi:hypothetical protein